MGVDRAYHPLDHPAHAALTGPHAHFAERSGRALRYPTAVTPWTALPPDPGPEDWAALAAFAAPDGTLPLLGTDVEVPDGWETTVDHEGVRLVGDAVDAVPDPEAVLLTAADVPEMLDLVARTQPGPFTPRTVELGTYLGIREGGALVAMAGERLHLPGYTEVSAVCTDPAHRGKGLAGRLVKAVSAVIRDRGETPFLHTGAANTNAIRLYESLGFHLRTTTRFRTVRAPEHMVPGA
ncbi:MULTISPECIES: GNAT family N-acetyltransferase [unclassified Streptomyces]|uniref:GNAT family N-acetyltransferase n=1 Tax=unclassified Streptomyces TaxID=2593676 RepID=UPI00278C0B31|nr:MULTISPECIES: GNAT family N-acetyltransferase [unclassified Streptomyces]